jgi:hypothetical protein
MNATELGRKFVAKVQEYLVSLPFDLKVLQEAVVDTDLDHGVRELCAAVLLNAHGPQEGALPDPYIDDVLFLRVALEAIARDESEGARKFRERYAEVFEGLVSDVALFKQSIGAELWTWVEGRARALTRLSFKGKRPVLFVDDEASGEALYEDGLDFQTNYKVTEERVQNKLRRPESIVEVLQKKRA